MEDKAKRVQVMIRETQKLYLDRVAESEGISFSALVRRILDDYRKQRSDERLREAAAALYTDYAEDDELTVFSVLDGEDFG